MSRGTGTGQPAHFKCPRLARMYARFSILPSGYSAEAARHVVTLTGRTRKRKHGCFSQRFGPVSREYRCACGHVGWSGHCDLERAETEGGQRR